MHYRIEKVLGPGELEQIRTRLEAASFVDGRVTASGAAAAVKKNLQLPPESQLRKELVQLVQQGIGRSEKLSAHAFPKVMAPPTFARYEPGMEYGAHVDAPFLNNGQMRADISMTVFLNEPEEYEGGELVIDQTGSESLIKLPAGDAFIYPTTYLHRVAPVTRGVRLVAVTWFQSFVPDERHRTIAIQLNSVKAALEADPARAKDADTLRAALFNLMREWWRP
ncbi:MAG TPA: Fe2+-dependent dioxygenase [Thermohalobaculum sp.]|nr:Fe2+-dependent dioxygenase [Thermohalobaculum sp.]